MSDIFMIYLPLKENWIAFEEMKNLTANNKILYLYILENNTKIIKRIIFLV